MSNNVQQKYITLLEKIKVSDKVKEEIKTKIKYLYVFRDFDKKINAILVTDEDKVYCFGGNCNGVLGFGHNNSINESTFNEELSDKKIVDFKNSRYHTIARTSDGKLYSWGSIRCFDNEEEKQFKISKPQLNEDLINENIIGICCGSKHTLALTLNKEVYEWDHNKKREIGIRSDSDYDASKAYKLDEFNGEKVQTVSCGSNYSIALTEKGYVFSWGHNCCGQLVIKEEKKTVVIIEKISSGSDYSLLLSVDGHIYVFNPNDSTQHKISNNGEKQLTPKKLSHSEKFSEIAANYRYNISAALTKDAQTSKDLYYVWGECPNGLPISEPEKTKFTSFDEIFIKLTENNIPFENGKYENDWEQLKPSLGEGSFGEVFKVSYKLIENTFFAMKKIPVFRKDITFDQVLNELNILAFLKEANEFLVKYHKGWFEQDLNKKNTTIYIQMDLCDKNLSQFLKEIRKDAELFLNEFNITKMGYFVLSEIFVEILKGVKYLHSKKIMHRDLHPDNILVKKRPNGNCIKIGDFGLAKVHEINNTQNVIAHQHYQAPEVEETTTYDTKIDIYSLGMILVRDLFKSTINRENLSDYIISKFDFLDRKCDNMTSARIPKIRPECELLLKESEEWCFDKNQFSLVKEELFNRLTLSNNNISYVQEIIVSKLFQKYTVLNTGKYCANWVEIEKLGEGSYGTVFKAKHNNENTIFAMTKSSLTFDDYFYGDPKRLLKRYINILELNNEFLVQHHDVWFEYKFQLINGIRELTDTPILFIQMDLCDKTLSDIDKEIKNDSKLYSNNSLTQLGYYLMSELFIEILKGVKYLHNNNIIHRDLNPYNILVKLQKNGNCIKIAGFHLATVHKTNKLHTQDRGHIRYMALEEMTSRCYDTKADIFSLGIILKELFKIDFYENSSSDMASKYKCLEHLYELMTATNPQKRPVCEQILHEKEKWAINQSEFNFKEELLLAISYQNRSYVQNIIISKLSHIY